ncbi:hypothetical protein [uncultured Zobellia sp.]|uniref:hypothetical protein n=1 Tax=uncultured Zobellia sp. TaxID=255433 RepID=UPI002591EEAA|nr:hypothetical protein [uncultured Zobellia sp.]
MKSFLKLAVLSILIMSCGGKDNPTTSPQEEVKELGAFNLVFPDNNLICTEGDDVGTEDISIDLLWSKSTNATSYDVQITNQESGEVSTQSSTTPEMTVTLKKNTQYTWIVTAKLDDITKSSSAWNFYTEGISVENYAPFPAQITVSDNGNETVEINWEGNDLDNDIVSYDIHFGTTTSPELVHTTTDDSESLTLLIIYYTDHYLEIVTTDNVGNKSKAKTTVNFQD